MCFSYICSVRVWLVVMVVLGRLSPLMNAAKDVRYYVVKGKTFSDHTKMSSQVTRSNCACQQVCVAKNGNAWTTTPRGDGAMDCRISTESLARLLRNHLYDAEDAVCGYNLKRTRTHGAYHYFLPHVTLKLREARAWCSLRPGFHLAWLKTRHQMQYAKALAKEEGVDMYLDLHMMNNSHYWGDGTPYATDLNAFKLFTSGPAYVMTKDGVTDARESVAQRFLCHAAVYWNESNITRHN